MLVYVYRVPMCSSSVGPRVRVVRVLSSALRFALDRNTITPPQTSDSSDLENVNNERKKPELYDLRDTHTSPIGNHDVENDEPDSIHFRCTASGLFRPESLTST